MGFQAAAAPAFCGFPTIHATLRTLLVRMTAEEICSLSLPLYQALDGHIDHHCPAENAEQHSCYSKPTARGLYGHEMRESLVIIGKLFRWLDT